MPPAPARRPRLTEAECAEIVRVWNGAATSEEAARELGRQPGSLRKLIARLRLQETGVAAAYGVLLTVLSATVFLLWGREKEGA